jgi:hypothetical protein
MKVVGARDAGSRRAVQREAGGTSHHGPPNLRCPRNGKQTGFLLTKNQLSSQTTGRPETGGWEGDEGRSVSPDTGQQGDLSQDRL